VNWTSAAIGLGGLFVAGFSLWLTYRTRLSPYQQKLYERQLEAATDVLLALGTYHDAIMGIVAVPGVDLKAYTGNSRGKFFEAWRKWSLILSAEVGDAVGTYVGTLTRVTNNLSSAPRTDKNLVDLTAAYAGVLTAARKDLNIEELSEKTLQQINSRPQLTSSPLVQDPLYAKADLERPSFKGFRNEVPSASTAVGAARVDAQLREWRNDVYINNRNLFLVHTWRPSTVAGQVAEISIRLAEHKRTGSTKGQASPDSPLSDGFITKVEYDLGSFFRTTFEKSNSDQDFRLDVDAYGSTLCVARVHFKDGSEPVTLYRYLDFIKPSRPPEAREDT